MDSDTSDDIAEDEAIFTILAASAQTLYDSDSMSDSETEEEWGGSKKGKAANIPRDFEGAYNMVRRNYFMGEHSIYNESTFERRFGCPRSVMSLLFDAVRDVDPFVLKTDRATGRAGIRPLVRAVSAMRMLKYGDCADRLDVSL